MLHADLNGKIGPDAEEAERREDVLTSTVFGTLFLVRAWPVVTAWLSRAHQVGRGPALAIPDAAALAAADYWFWPRLADATTGGIVEPDLIISLAGFVAIVEAKYYSGK